MYLLKEECRFEHSGVMYCIPKNYYLDAEEPWYFSCMPRGKDFKVCYELSHEKKGIKQAFREHQKETYQTSAPIERIEHNGLTGYCSTFGDEEEEVFEARFFITDKTEGYNRFIFSITTPNFDIEKIKASPEFKKLFESIWKTNQKTYKIKHKLTPPSF